MGDGLAGGNGQIHESVNQRRKRRPQSREVQTRPSTYFLAIAEFSAKMKINNN